MANSQVAVTEGSGKNAATYSVSEGTTKEIQRVALNTNAGVEIGTSSAPVQVTLANTGSNSTAVKVDGSAVTQPVSLTSTTITGTVAVTESGTWSNRITDGTNTAAVKAASTAPATTDPALVVGVSTNSWDLTVGTGGSKTPRVSIDTAQLAALATASTAYAAGVQPVALPSDQVKIPIHGDVAHDGVDSGSPVKQGGKATTSLSALTMVSNADRTDLFAGVDGVRLVRPHTNLEDIVTGNATNTDGTSTQCIAAQAAGIKTYLTSIVLCNTSATNVTVDIKDGSTVKVSLPLPATSGCVFNPPVPIPGTAATAWNFDGSAAATTVTCSMIGFKSKI